MFLLYPYLLIGQIRAKLKKKKWQKTLSNLFTVPCEGIHSALYTINPPQVLVNDIYISKNKVIKHNLDWLRDLPSWRKNSRKKKFNWLDQKLGLNCYLDWSKLNRVKTQLSTWSQVLTQVNWIEFYNYVKTIIDNQVGSNVIKLLF